MEKNQDEKIQRLVKEGIEKAEKEKANKHKTARLVAKIVLLGSVIVIAIWVFSIYGTISKATELNDKCMETYDDKSCDDELKYFTENEKTINMFSLSGTWGTDTIEMFETDKRNRANIDKVRNEMLSQFQNHSTTTANIVKKPSYVSYTSKNTMKVVYTNSNAVVTKTFPNEVLSCDEYSCEDWENLTVDDLIKQLKNAERATITTQRPGYISFVVFSTGIDPNGEKYMRSDTMSWSAKEETLTPTPSKTYTPYNPEPSPPDSIIDNKNDYSPIKIVTRVVSGCSNNDLGMGEGIVNPTVILVEGGNPTKGYTWKTPNGLPDALAIDEDTGVVQMESVIFARENGETFLLEVSDGISTTRETIRFDVKDASTPPPDPNDEFPMPSAGCPMATFQLDYRPAVSLPDAYVGKPYGANIYLIGGTPPYQWDIIQDETSHATADTLGLKFHTRSGIISGTPTEVGKVEFTIKVIDSEGNIAPDTLMKNTLYTINVRN